MKIYRDHRGRFATTKKYLEYAFSIGTVSFIIVAIVFSFTNKTIAVQEPKVDIEALVEKLSGEKLEAKIQKLRGEIVERLAQCESGKVENPTDLVTYDPSENGRGEIPSFGPHQWKRQTFQIYQEMKTGEKITLREAMIRATDLEMSSTMVDYVLFETEKSWKEWQKCSTRLGLAKEIEIIKRLIK